MSVIGAATGVAQPTGTTAAAAALVPAVAHAAGGTTASAAGSVQTQVELELARPLEIGLVNADALEVAGVYQAASAHGLKVAVDNREISPREVLRTLSDPVETGRADRLESLRTRLLADLREGRGDPKELVKKLDGLSVMIAVERRQEEKKLFMKKIMKLLMLGILTPQVIAQAKAFGLVKFLKDAIKEMVKSGNVAPNQIAAIAGMMAEAGIQMPVLEDLVIRHERNVQSVQNASRAARGLEPTTTGPSQQALAGVTLAAPGIDTSILG